MSSFVSTKQHVEVCKRLEQKIESLQNELLVQKQHEEELAREIKTLRQKLEEQKQQNEKCHKTRLRFIDEQVQVLREKDREIESLRSEITELRYVRHLAIKRDQILRDNLTEEQFAELCELWPELSPE